jgi:hypothetical protein
MDEIVYRGLNKLEAIEVATIQRIAAKEFGKLKRGLGDASLVLDVKKINKAGKRATYEARARVDMPSIRLQAEHSDWELQRALHRMFENLKVEVEHKFKKNVVKWPNRILKE